MNEQAMDMNTTGSERGKRKKISPARRALIAFLRLAQRVPLAAVEWTVDLSAVLESRNRRENAPSWTVLFAKAFGLAAMKHEALRTAYLSWPWQRLHVHDSSTALVFIEREWQGEAVVLPYRLRHPERTSLQKLNAALEKVRSVPVFENSQFRRFLRVGSYPWLLLRFVTWQSICVTGRLRIRRMGTFTISSLGKEGADIQQAMTPLTSYLSFGPILASGQCKLALSFDHRVLDGMAAARFLKEIELQMKTAVLDELRGIDSASPRNLPTRNVA